MATIAEQKDLSHNVLIESSIEQMCKGQDQTYQGSFVDEESGEAGQWAAVTDGHGSNTCINYLRTIPQAILNEVMGKPDPAEILFKMVNQYSHVWSNESSGATLNIVKVYKDRLVCINMGDSQAAVYKNGELAFITETQDGSNEKEIDRLTKENSKINFYTSPTIEITSDGKMYSVPSKYIIHSHHITLALSQALGHCGITGFAPNVVTIPYGPSDTVHVVIGSDGFWDMVAQKDMTEVLSLMNKSSDELLKSSVDRWLQPWEMCKDRDVGIFEIGSFTREQSDDVCVVKIDIIPST